MANAGHRPSAGRVVHILARLLAAAGLAVDAAIHASLADQYDAVTATFGEGDLFRAEAALACLAALLVLVWHRFPADAFAWLVAAGGLALLMIYRYIDVGAHGPFSDMYEPIWTTDKKITVVAQTVTIVAATYLMVTDRSRRGARVV
ncbi:hypothetical protein [Actinacidiphila sp. ITFR-21]|uniref:hypothetical protein n=1 Tax=Actinacidiphila sp. ITFR-21 TaxID=3075199 RepID=UPI00288A0D1D|nr:hypothetical protein [Streptomyces sp. ITFR-21]WNI18203.1 hypothetical protein RLT57_23425 [Streptomyces sp. ITFR-21]